MLRGVIACLGLLFAAVGGAGAETREIRLHAAMATGNGDYRVAKGTDINLVNELEESLYDIAIVNMASGVPVATIQELNGGQSVRLGFGSAGTFRIFCSREKGMKSDRERFIEVQVVTHSAI